MKEVEEIIVGTHSGVFHADEIFATAVIEAAENFKIVEIIRTRNPDELKECDLVVDVGGVYDVGEGRFDHHQVDGPEPRANGVPYAAFGLVWDAFGRRHALFSGLPATIREAAWTKVEETIVQAVDAADCGHDLAEYGEVRPYTVSNAISSFNPAQRLGSKVEREEEAFAAFMSASEVARDILDQVVSQAVVWARAQATVELELDRSYRNGVLVLPRGVPWKEHLLSSTHENAAKTLFVVFPSDDPDYMVQVVPRELGSFAARKDLPEEWAGLRGEELRRAADIPSAVFCHKGRFICGADRLEDAVLMARRAVEH